MHAIVEESFYFSVAGCNPRACQD